MPRLLSSSALVIAVMWFSPTPGYGQANDYVRFRSPAGFRACNGSLTYLPTGGTPYMWSDAGPEYAYVAGVVTGAYTGVAHGELDLQRLPYGQFGEPWFATSTVQGDVTAIAQLLPPPESATFGGLGTATHLWLFDPILPTPPGLRPLGTCIFMGSGAALGQIVVTGTSSCDGFGALTVEYTGQSWVVFGTYMTLAGPQTVGPIQGASGFNYTSFRWLDQGGPGTGGQFAAQTASVMQTMGFVADSAASVNMVITNNLYGNWQ